MKFSQAMAAAATFLISIPLFATEISTTCKFDDYTAIENALEDVGSIKAGPELVGEIRGLLIVETPLYCEDSVPMVNFLDKLPSPPPQVVGSPHNIETVKPAGQAVTILVGELILPN
jgi:hypothetical protein